MEETTYLEHLALGVSPDSGLMEGMSCTEPLEQSVLGAWAVVRPEETNTPERPALAARTGMFYSVGAADMGYCYSY